jgi:tryptophan 2,3-dioxygenase
MNELTYSRYIRVSELLKLQEPQSRAEVPLTRACEHFFIVTHQTSELWLAQVLLDLDEAGLAIAEGRYPDAQECLQRAAVVLDVMTANLDVLATMPPGRFACFRGDLGRATGAQSAQFAQLDRRLGLGRNGECPLLDALEAACARQGASLAGLLRAGNPDHPELARVALSMLDVSRKAWKWKVMHLELTAKMLGHQHSGTGGSSGTKYLAGRLAMPFETLWAAVSAMHQDSD